MAHFTSITVYFSCTRSKNRLIRRSYPSAVPSFVPLYTVGLDRVWSLLAVSRVNSLDLGFDIASVNLSCSGAIGTSSLAAGGKRLLPLVDLTHLSQCGILQSVLPMLHGRIEK